MRVFFVIVGFILLVGGIASPNYSQETSSIDGTSINSDWSISVAGNSGTFFDGNEEWEIEFFLETGGLNGFSRLLSFLGRKPENFIRVDVFIDSFGDNFLVYLYDYKRDLLESQAFAGTYSLGDLDNGVTLMEGYIPRGTIPDYVGKDFVIDSPTADISPERGAVELDGADIVIFPVYYIEVSATWKEFWSVGINPETGRTYMIQSYLSPVSWVIDLWDGTVRTLEIGGALVSDVDVNIERDFTLESLVD